MPDNSAIREQNDLFRTNQPAAEQDGNLGRILTRPGVQDLPGTLQAQLLQQLRQFDDFNEDNDPHGEHDFGAINLDGKQFFWKIDYYDHRYQYGSPDPADRMLTRRVLTLMLASEY